MVNITSDSLDRYTVVVVGCGGTGSQLLSMLMQLCNNIREKIYRIILVDGDSVENKNLQNQKCLEGDIGYNKAYSMCKRYSYLFPDLAISSYENYLRSDSDIGKLVGCEDNLIIAGCVDNNPARKVMNDFFIKRNNFKNLIYIDSGNGTDKRSGQIVTGYKQYDTIILQPVGNIFQNILTDTKNPQHGGTCVQEIKESPQNIATNVYAASNIFSIFVNILMYNVVKSNLVFFDAEELKVFTRG